MNDPWRVLTPHQATTARAFLDERARDRRHLVVYLSGAHAYGFPSPDSDLDLKCVHIAPTGSLVGILPPTETAERTDIVDGVELDYGSNELSPVLLGVLKGNGNYLERILGDLALVADPLLASAREVVRPTLSRRIARHYIGFARSQLELFDKKPTAKRALYVLRTAATGRYLLAHGDLVTDISRLGDFVPPDVSELIAIKRQAEKQELAPELVAPWRTRLVAAMAAVDPAVPSSVLPVEPSEASIADLDAWLREVRRSYW